MMFVLSGGKIDRVTNVIDLRCSHTLGQAVLLLLVTIFHGMPGVRLSKCPLLRSYTDTTGTLLVNKTTMMPTGSTLHCQWLVASSIHQVRNAPDDGKRSSRGSF